MKLKLITSGLAGGAQTQVVNAETGEPVKGVTSVRLVHESVTEIPVLTIELNDFDAEAEVLANGGVVVEKPAPYEAPLMIFSERVLCPEAIQHIREILDHPLCTRRMLLFEPGLDVYQSVDGRWVPVRPDTPERSPEVLEAEGITAGE